MTLPLRVTVAPERADAAPGDALTFDVTVRNAGDIVEHYGVERAHARLGAAAPDRRASGREHRWPRTAL